MKSKKIAIIRGTGFANLDGSLVTVVTEGDGISCVVPFGTKDVIPISLDSRCIQKVDNNEKYSYKFTISKDRTPNGQLPTCMETKTIVIDDAFRNISLDIIVEYLNSHLKHILTME